MTKRIVAAALSAVLCFALAACGSKPAGSTSGPKDYAAAITAARNDEDNEYQTILAKSTLTEDEASMAQMTLDVLGVTEDQLDDYAISLSLINVRAYAVAVLKPAEGQADAVKEGVEQFVKAQQQSFQNYLQDQYEVAKAAKVSQLPSGEIVLVMCEDAADVYGKIEAALK